MSLNAINFPVIQAADVAAQWHAPQRRKGAAQEPYVNHLLEVAALVAAAGGDRQAIIAALLHDAIEDQKISAETIAEQFSEHVAGIVLEVTDDKMLSRHEHKATYDLMPCAERRRKPADLARKGRIWSRGK
jgi:(p)ppGpp synthase/HD superfamily hydrolase